jgi:hypothetical protein
MLEDRAGEALHHWQQAVLEMIGAARASLDLLEDIVKEPGAVSALVESLVSTLRPSPASPAAPTAGQPAPVEHIPIR